jgi:hypothetical protein
MKILLEANLDVSPIHTFDRLLRTGVQDTAGLAPVHHCIAALWGLRLLCRTEAEYDGCTDARMPRVVIPRDISKYN